MPFEEVPQETPERGSFLINTRSTGASLGSRTAVQAKGGKLEMRHLVRQRGPGQEHRARREEPEDGEDPSSQADGTGVTPGVFFHCLVAEQL